MKSIKPILTASFILGTTAIAATVPLKPGTCGTLAARMR